MDHREGTEADTSEETPEERTGYFTARGCLLGCLVIAVAAVVLCLLALVALVLHEPIPLIPAPP